MTETALAEREAPVVLTLPERIEQALVQGNLAHLTTAERVILYDHMCESMGLNKLSTPFAYLELNRKLVLYATKNCTDQLRKIHHVSLTIDSREEIGDLYVVTATARLPNGRSDSEIGAVAIGGLKGENLANAMMKAGTKAKRRVTLSIVGLSLLDESEVGSIPGAVVVAPEDPEAAEGPTIGKRAPDEPDPPPLDEAQWQQEVAQATQAERQTAAADPAGPVSARTLETLRNHLARTGGALTPDAENMTQADASAWIRELSKQRNQA